MSKRRCFRLLDNEYNPLSKRSLINQNLRVGKSPKFDDSRKNNFKEKIKERFIGSV